ncbi:UNVERIFIED_CONTAM: hypothetical protein K2H54_058880 [Gekko kuhli]
MEADPVLAVLMAIMAVEAHLRQFKEAAQWWAEVVTAGRLWMCAAWAHFQVTQRVQARQRQARKRRHIRNLLNLERLPGRRWWVYPRSLDWWDNFVLHIWGEEKWLENIRMSRAVAHQFGLAQSTMAGIVVEVTGAITERLLKRVVYLRNPDRNMAWSAIISGHMAVSPGQRGGTMPGHIWEFAAVRTLFSSGKRWQCDTVTCCEEVECLLQTLLDLDAGLRVMTSTHLETQGLFVDVAAAMRGQGYRRTGAQVRTKFKRVKGEFFNALEDWHGIPPAPGYRPPQFQLIRALWEQEGRPGWRLRTPNHPVVMVSSPEALPAPQSGQEEEEGAIMVSSAPESEAGEGQQPDPAAGAIQGIEERLRTMVAEMVNIRRTINHHSYRLGFIQRGMVRLRNMVQRSHWGG